MFDIEPITTLGNTATNLCNRLMAACGIDVNWEDARQTATRVVQLTIVGWILLATSAVAAVVLYSVVYNVYVPEALLTVPLYYEFPRTTQDISLMPSPATVLRLKSPYVRRQSYDILMQFELPESPTNFDVGMFMVSLAMANTRNTSCQLLPNIACSTSKRSRQQYPIELVGVDPYKCERNGCLLVTKGASLRYRSSLKNYLQSAAFVLPLVLGWINEHQTISVTLASDFYDEELMTAEHLWVATTVSEPLLQVASAELQIRAHFKGAAYMMHEWFFVTFAVTSWFTTTGLFITNVLIMYFTKDWLHKKLFGSEEELNESIQMEELDTSSLLNQALETDPSLRFDQQTGLYSFDVSKDPEKSKDGSKNPEGSDNLDDDTAHDTTHNSSPLEDLRNSLRQRHQKIADSD